MSKQRPGSKESDARSQATSGASPDPDEYRANLHTFTVVKIAQLGLARELSTAALIEPRYGLKNAELKVLLALGIGSMTMIQLSRETRLDKAWVSRSVYGLIERRLLTKSGVPDDGRAVLLELTTAGRKLMEEIMPVLAERERRLLMGLDKDHVNWILDTLQARLDRMRENPPFG